MESALGLKFRHPPRVFLAKDFGPGFKAFTFFGENRDPVIVIEAPWDPALIRHEITHAILEQHGIRPPKWIRKGIAEFMEGLPNGGYRHDRAALLEGSDPVCEDSLKRWKGSSSLLRAAAWREIYEMHKGSGIPFSVILGL